MTRNKLQDIPLHIQDRITSPPTKTPGRRLVKDLAELAAVLDDDVIIIQRNNQTYRVNKSVLFGGASEDYGSIYTPDGQAESPARSQVTMIAPALYTGFASDGAAAGVTVDAANSKITVDVTGIYLITAQFSFSGSNSATFHFHPAIISDSPVTQIEGARCVRKLGTGGDVGSASLTGLASMTAGDELGIMIHSDADTKTINTWHSQLTIHRVG